MTAPTGSRNVERAACALAALTVVVASGYWYTRRDSRAGPVVVAQTDSYAGSGATAAGGHAAHGVSAGDVGAVYVPPQTLTRLGIGTVAAETAFMRRMIRTTGNVVYNETRLTTVAPKYAGFVERLYVDFTGQAVRRGQPLLEIYSPELVAAQEELLSALRLERQLTAGGAAANVIDRTAGLVDAARRRLQLWDVSTEQVKQIENTQQVRHTVTLYAPAGGIVTEKMVQAGQAVDTGMPLYRLADLTTVWIEADIYEQDLRMVEVGELVQVLVDAYPGESFAGRASHVYPDVRPDTRTGRIRMELANPGARLKPGMYATVLIEAPISERAVFVPRDAVMHSGTHAMVFVEESPGVFRARQIEVGSDDGGRTQILSGLVAGERVVNRANFLLDSESRLTDALGAMPGMNH